MEFKGEYYLVLEALAKGGKTAEEVARSVDMPPHDVEAVLNTLMAHGLVEARERGLILRRTAYYLTERGWEVLYKWRGEVKERLEKAAHLRKAGEDQRADEVLAPVEPILPALLAMGLLDLWLYSAALGEGYPAIADEATGEGAEAGGESGWESWGSDEEF
ncbi:MAG: helix-turn-helix domain-containing protein [Pyrobaculum sp.]